ncbi:MAG: hypothetical protein WCL06_09730 [Bacteroidota bacterium]
MPVGSRCWSTGASSMGDIPMIITVNNEADRTEFYKLIIEILLGLAKAPGNEKAIEDVEILYRSTSTEKKN